MMDILEEAHKDGVVVGLKAVADVVARQDIDVLLMNHPDTFNLMVIAFLELMGEQVPWQIDHGYKNTPAEKFSFFQMASIHGLPAKDWDNVDNSKYPMPDPHADPDDGPRGPGGYCEHAKPTFETWHRPYLAMLEQELFRQVANVAERFGRSTKLSAAEKEQYRQAAKLFRLPYFDYFRPRDYRRMLPGDREPDIEADPKTGKLERRRGTAIMNRIPYDFSLPQIFTLPKIMVKSLPDNELRLVRNPFFQFRLPKDALSNDEWGKSQLDATVPFIKERTMRYGSDKPRITLSLIEAGVYANFGAVTTNGVVPATFTQGTGMAQSPSGSLEAVHNDYHVYLGGFIGSRGAFGQTAWVGHMTSVPVAAFDPIFWIHHCQIDRLFAIWQAANPDSWFEDLPEEWQVFADAPLYPFRKTKSPEETFWTPNMSRDTTDFGYTYPDLKAGKTPAEIRKAFRELYEWSRRLVPSKEPTYDLRPPTHMEPLDVSKAQVFRFDPGSTEEYIFENLAPAPPAPKPAAQVVQTTMQTVKQTVEKVKNVSLSDDKPAAKFSHEWYIDDAVERMAKNGAFTIFYIIDLFGVSGDSGLEWTRLPGFVGLSHIFAAPNEACDNCGRQYEQSVIVTSTTPITSLLIDYVERGKLDSMEEKDVRPFLVKNLKWRVQTANGEVVDPRDLSENHQFRVSVSCKTAPLPGSEGQVTYQTYPDIVPAIISASSSSSSS